MMVNTKFIAGLFVLLFFTVSLHFGEKEDPKSFLVVGDSKVLLVDYHKSDATKPEVIWMWDALEASDLPEEYQTKKFNTMDECKPVNGGKQLLVSSSSGGVAVLDAVDRKVNFYATVPNAHSVELLPKNRLIAAASTHPDGNRVMLFDLDHPEKLLFEDSLYSAHGLVWLDERITLYALGYNVLRAYSMPTPDSLVLEKEWEIPGEGGHDLQLSADRQSLFLTEHTGAWRFDVSSGEFFKIAGFPDAENIKSIGEAPTGQMIFTVPEESWWTRHVSFHRPQRRIAFPDMKVYKARWYLSD